MTTPRTCDAHVDVLFVLSGHGLQTIPTITEERCQFGGLDRMILALYLGENTQDELGDEGSWKEIAAQVAMAASKFPEHYIAMEGGRCLGKDPMPRLEELAREGIKYLTLTHKRSHSWASACGLQGDVGLRPLGVQVIKRCEELGVLVDVSHCSDLTISDVLFHSRKPVIASHSGCRTVLPVPRNLEDAFIKGIAATGGIVHVPFARMMVGSMAGIIQHIDYICQLLGSAMHVGIGSDLDGAVMPAGINGPEDWSTVVIGQLSKRGYTAEQIGLIAGGNTLRLLGAGSLVGGEDGL